ncbi:hypothetical protein [Mucilaginibacter aquariorum]|uniref:Uncharacterized protein n=1 Tax=Mucilaginibacter aquariorum TaxID=2967225 RepID=A0ABT1T3A3_9SPHI|nr:hypothetical protein [Mucilaginibacter aquariorum]MCQ6959044.1 hypothetical protein [Mucilaginibacter aquariorum]
MNGISPWAAAASSVFTDNALPCIYTKNHNDFAFSIHNTTDSLWVLATWPKGGRIAFRVAYSPDGGLEVKSKRENDNGIKLLLNAVIGDITVNIQFPGDGQTTLRYTTTLKPHTELLIPFWPRDIIIPGRDGEPDNTAGKIWAKQIGTRSGMVYFSVTRPKSGSVFYLQNLSALNDYCQQTQTSAGETVGGEWPELGFALPPALDKPLQADKETIISDAIIVFDDQVPTKEADMVEQYLNMLAQAYLQLPKPDTKYQDWLETLKKGLHDLIESPGCWSQVAGHSYFNAYVSDYVTPPEIMVQLAVLLPLQDYVDWGGEKMEAIKVIKEALPTFYDEKLKTIMRWLPAAADKLEGEEEQKEPMTMDSWYLHHPLLNLSRLALKGEKIAEQLFLDSLEFAIKVAHHFKYDWPVFYKMDTLEVIKAETAPGKGGEHDVPGLYAHVMLQAYELTGKKRYLNEAETAAKRLQGLGFDLFYQANNTAFSAGALLRLSKITGNKVYKELSYLCLANVLKNVRLWDCDYGYGKNFPSFFCLFPLSDAPYTAVYEEQEVFCALHDYLRHAEGEDILPSVSMLLAEYIKYLLNRAIYYYPTMLPKDMLSDKVKIGEVDPKLWIALEDMHDGWEKSGEVGQEVYGAGNAFGILPRHYLRVPNENFMVYVDYPTSSFIGQKRKPITFNILGDNRLECRLVIVRTDDKKLPTFKVMANGQKQEVKGKTTRSGNIEYVLNGGQSVKISWS